MQAESTLLPSACRSLPLQTHRQVEVVMEKIQAQDPAVGLMMAQLTQAEMEGIAKDLEDQEEE